MATKTKVTIIGVGLLGGSLALSLKKFKNLELKGWNHRASSRRKASHLLPIAKSLEDAIRDADIVVLCSHSNSIGPFLKQLIPWLGPETLIMDVSSVKQAVVVEALKLQGMENHFLPCHPMAGKEKSGPDFADENLFQQKIVFVTPLPKTKKRLIEEGKDFWKKTGAVPFVLPASLHDRSVALTSHLPHLLSAAMMNLFEEFQNISPVFQKSIGTGFRDFTRIAAGNPVMWSDILELNSKEIRFFLSRYCNYLKNLENHLKKGQKQYWISFFEKARKSRDELK